nr:hypothetical protein [Tanacetum cinerariifolium]
MLMFCGVTRINLSLAGAASDVEKNSSDRGKQKLTTYEDSDVFETYSQLTTRNVRPRFSSDLPQASDSKYDGPSVSNQRKRTRPDSQRRPPVHEAESSKRIRHPCKYYHKVS